jgi:hypothetical protein
MSKLIKEEVSISEVEFITESVGGNKQHFIRGVFLQSEQKNRNGRLYPKALLQREVKRYNDNYISQKRAYGELGHPDSPTINLDRVSHIMTELYEDGNNFMGKAKILDTPNGRIVKNLLDEGCKLGVSSRGVGSLKPTNGVQLVQDDFYLATAADIVADPSAPDAFVQGIMEGKEWVMEGGMWSEMDYDKAKKQLKEARMADFEEHALRLFEKYLSKIRNL